MTRSIAIICGLKSEAAIIGRALASLDAGARAGVWVSGANAQRAKEMARLAIAEDKAACVMSIGVSGALAPDLAPGDLLIGSSVRTTAGEEFACDRALAAKLFGRNTPPAHSQAVLLGSDVIVANAAEKERLLLSTGAIAVDMESHGAARAAVGAGVPFLAIRAIADPAHRALPKSALGAVAPDGSTRVFATLLKCAKAPGEFPALLQLGSDSNKALKTLGRDLGGLLGALLVALDL